jgi:hypothetical protein
MLAHPLEGLVPRSHDESLAVLVTHLELPHSGSLGRLLVRGLDNPDVLRALSSRYETRQKRSLGEQGLL